MGHWTKIQSRLQGKQNLNKWLKTFKGNTDGDTIKNYAGWGTRRLTEDLPTLKRERQVR